MGHTSLTLLDGKGPVLRVQGEFGRVTVFSTCPPSNLFGRDEYLGKVVEVARWSEAAGCRGILVYTDNGLVDAWLVSQVIAQSTTALCPLVAVQPVYMHPYSVAKLVASMGHLHRRRLYLNMVAGGFKNDLNALNDPTPHDRRYDRLVEYARLIQLLLDSERAVTFAGEFYQVQQLKMTPAIPSGQRPEFFVSGSSEAGLAAARAIGATAVMYPKPAAAYADEPLEAGLQRGIRIGIVARETEDEAWAVAWRRFPEDRKGQIAHELAMKVSDSAWHRQLSELGEGPVSSQNPYWLHPFQNYQTFCPYLVGSHEVVAQEVSRYIRLGHEAFILDVPPDPVELEHIGTVFAMASAVTEA
jgi:alkanesulfonate monooxygenase